MYRFLVIFHHFIQRSTAEKARIKHHPTLNLFLHYLAKLNICLYAFIAVIHFKSGTEPFIYSKYT